MRQFSVKMRNSHVCKNAQLVANKVYTWTPDCVGAKVDASADENPFIMKLYTSELKKTFTELITRGRTMPAVLDAASYRYD